MIGRKLVAFKTHPHSVHLVNCHRNSGRIEPRALKRRLKNYALLTKPRRIAQEEVRKNGHPKKQR